VTAAKRGDAEKILSTPANLLARFHGLFPGVTADLLGAAGNLLLPNGSDPRRRRGRETRALNDLRWLSAATVLGRAAARRLLQPHSV
jgi:hypothetical protein